jgi:hypothetical protein
MFDSIPRDEDGYVDLDRLPDHESALDLAAFGAPPPLSDAVWEIIVTSTPLTDPAAVGLDVDLLVGALPDTDPTEHFIPETDTDMTGEGDQPLHDPGQDESVEPILAPPDAGDDDPSGDGSGPN